ncbi:thioredoxin [Myxococcota bacterium]|nr:thioredoxin [Myxococcota bacterium]
MSETLTFRCPSCGGLNRVPEARLTQGPRCGRCQTALDLSAHPQEVDDDALERLVRASPVPVLVDFWAPWCGPCRAVAPHLTALAKERAGSLLIVKVNTDQHQRTAGAMQVQAIPTLMLYKGGALAKRQAGALMGPQLRAFVDS